MKTFIKAYFDLTVSGYMILLNFVHKCLLIQFEFIKINKNHESDFCKDQIRYIIH